MNEEYPVVVGASAYVHSAINDNGRLKTVCGAEFDGDRRNASVKMMTARTAVTCSYCQQNSEMPEWLRTQRSDPQIEQEPVQIADNNVAVQSAFSFM